ncbi:hypothetical protein B0H10DRAFT_576527 [Mycena sp. CBHHK59/15]|nr:hypothetical protein B0H10DRAFT_576527 [Mycena sp. CBHHK59/15]
MQSRQPLVRDVPGVVDPYQDRFEEDQRRERSLLLDRFFTFCKAADLYGTDTCAQFIDYMERLLIIAILDRSGLRTVLTNKCSDVESFLALDIITLDELKQIYVAVHLMSPQKVLCAINDAFRTDRDAHNVILGRRIYNEDQGGQIPLKAWDLFEDVTPCRHCALQGSYSLEAWTEIDRLATLSLRFSQWQPPNVAAFSRADMLFHLSGVFAERKWKCKSPRARFSHKFGLWVEKESPSGLYLKFPLANADVYHRFLHSIQNLDDVFSVLPWAPAFQQKSDALVPKARTNLCASRIRTAATLEGLSSASWRDHQAFTECDARALHNSSRDPSVLHMIVLDRAGGDVEHLKDNLATAFLFSAAGICDPA